MSILLADDDAQLADFLSKSLESEGYSVHTALDEESVLSELRRQNYKLIILDLNFGATDGLDLLARLRAQGLETPVMVLSARDQVNDRIQSLNSGADDYITKPFSFQELAARANALLRRKADPSLSILRVEDLELDPATHKVHRGKKEIKLTPKEFEMLHLLLRRAGDTVARAELLSECWGPESLTDSNSNLVDVYVNYLRRKVDSPHDQKLIYTVRGIGYRLGRPPASLGAGVRALSGPARPAASAAKFPLAFQESSKAILHDSPLPSLVQSVAHDLAQPLTSVRCFLEVLAMRKGSIGDHAADIKIIEQQADRAIALVKGISGMVREMPPPSEPWISLDALLTDVFNDFAVLQHSGLLGLNRQWDRTIRVTSNPVLRQLLVLFVSKLVGRNTRALSLTVSDHLSDGVCHLEFQWKSRDENAEGIQDARQMLTRDWAHIESMAHSISCTLHVSDNAPGLVFEIPAVASAGDTELGIAQ